MKLPRGYSPIKAVQAAGIRGNASFRQPPGGGWSGIVRSNDGTWWDVEELEESWQLKLASSQNGSDVYADADLEQLLRRVLK